MAKRNVVLTDEEIGKFKQIMHCMLKYPPDAMSGLNVNTDIYFLNKRLDDAPVIKEKKPRKAPAT